MKRLFVLLAMSAACACSSPSSGIDCRSFPNVPACNPADVSVDSLTPDGGATDTTPVSCVPTCAGKTCGPDGCGGFCGSCGAGTTCRDDSCVEGACGDGGVTVSGRFEVGDGFVFDSATVALEHKMDIDAFEDGCVTRIRVELKKGFGCLLVVEAEGALARGGGLRVSYLELSADSQCPGFPDEREGVYADTVAMRDMLIVPGVYDVAADNAPSACIVTNVEVRLAGTLGDGERTLDIRPSSIVLSGEMVSAGSTTASCPCAPSCSGRDCGDDGCGSSCGTCDANEQCITGGVCECRPSCSGRECGDDGCGGSCGGCDVGDRCDGGLCVTCSPSCAGKECGDDGCGGSCGGCAANEDCAGGACVCAPSCDGRECGSDGCGGSCGSCAAGESCASGRCDCVPDCDGAVCGDDGCGGSCGTCPGGESCVDGSCPGAECGDGVCESGEELGCPSDCLGGNCDGVCDFLDSLLCPDDCQASACGDGTCAPGESHGSCAEDCATGCGNGTCSAAENVTTCGYDCSTCGDQICGGPERTTCPLDCLGF